MVKTKVNNKFPEINEALNRIDKILEEKEYIKRHSSKMVDKELCECGSKNRITTETNEYCANCGGLVRTLEIDFI